MTPEQNSMVLEHLPLAAAMASKFFSIPREDALQEAELGLVTAASKFNASMGVKFSTFATVVIRNHVVGAMPKYAALPEQTIGVDYGSSDDDRHEAVNAAMAKLTPRARLAVNLRFGDAEHTFEEIGEKLGFSMMQARALVTASLVRLKELLEPEL